MPGGKIQEMERGTEFTIDTVPTASPFFSEELESHDKLYQRSACIIQRTWRRHVDTQVFKYFKMLVSFRNQGDPRLLLRSINPREANMLDAAAGAYIRFRLGGISFPPSIYYKIFTHRPIVDMCANSPKDYTHPGAKRPIPRQVHNGRALVLDDQSGWYRRVENNGWRILCGKIVLLGDIIETETSSRKIQFHHSKLQRRQDVERKRRMRKMEWFKKMYKQGSLHARTQHPEAAALVECSAQGMVDAMETLGANHIVDWEVDELIEWTNALNFDEYIREWRDQGTSTYSSKGAESKLAPSSGSANEGDQMGTYRSVLHPLTSSLIQ
ncbi:protein MFI [Osmerus mordax]|uniref:protein MFI n=1 Tax=Osmerus mordax TaxID=8014 RepID=UPI00350EAE2A